MVMRKQRIPFLTTEMYRHLPDQTVEVINRLISEVNAYQDDITELTNAIITLQNQIKNQPIPTPTGEWYQILAFHIEDMGTTPRMCLQNTREGFGIQTGTFASAKADMDSQIQNGTLHAGTPPLDVSVPLYYDGWSLVPDGHAAVWDHGVVYSDGIRYASINSVTVNYMGWGELCDGVRVVAPVVS